MSNDPTKKQRFLHHAREALRLLDAAAAELRQAHAGIRLPENVDSLVDTTEKQLENATRDLREALSLVRP
jgi:hypothetical protein